MHRVKEGQVYNHQIGANLLKKCMRTVSYTHLDVYKRQTHRFGKEYGIQRSWKRMEDSVKKDKDGFMEVPEQLEIPFE